MKPDLPLSAVAPEPMTPPDCNLTDFKFMPVDCQRLRDSDLNAEQTPEENWAAFLIWLASWHQVPAASIPDSDDWLAQKAGYKSRGRIDPRWKEVRAGALRGFVMCSDGRMYHPVVAEKAREAWLSKLKNRWMAECKRIRKHNERHGTSHPLPELEAWLSNGCRTGDPLGVASDMDPLSQRQDGFVAYDTPPVSQRQEGAVACDTPPLSHECRQQNANKGQGQGQGQGQGSVFPEQVPVGTPPPRSSPEGEAGGGEGEAGKPPPYEPPDCPHQRVLALWAEVMPELPQHDPGEWRNARSDNLKLRWRERAVRHRWASADDGLLFLRRLFGYIRGSTFLMGQSRPTANRERPFVIDLEWLVRAGNWSKVIEGKYHHTD